MQTFGEFLKKNKVPASLETVLHETVSAMISVSSDVSLWGKGELDYLVDEINASGDKQIPLDRICNETFVDNVRRCPFVTTIASEELDRPYRQETGPECYSVVVDPLDGSSIAELNLAVGTIVGIYEGEDVIGKTGRQQVVSMMSVIGPSLTLLFTFGGNFKKGVHEFIYNEEEGVFELRNANLRLAESGKIVSPGNMKIVADDPWYLDLIADMAKNGYALRYSGGMVPDVNQIIRKGGGIYMYPGSKDKPEGKLRLLYECAPIALLIENAGGKAVYGDGDILDIPIREYHQKTPIFLGSAKEVQLALSYSKK